MERLSPIAVRGRFAPTPSGLLHLGNARTALLVWLQVRQANGTMLLRLEDIDTPRCKPEYADDLIREMCWLGLDWDEGPDIGGPSGPYEQSERLARYDAALARLEEQGVLYPCFCSRAELLAVASAPHGLAAEGPAYLGTCRGLTPDERKAKRAAKAPSLRFIMPRKALYFLDGVAGEQWFPPAAGGDFVVKRADGIFAYQLAVVVDDAAMGITHVLRGMDLLDSTPRQLMLYEALGLAPPSFAHVPLLYGPDGQKLSKRQGSLSLAAVRSVGTAPETVIGILAYISGLIDRPEPVRPQELISGFRMEQVGRTPAVLSEELIKRLTGE